MKLSEACKEGCEIIKDVPPERLEAVLRIAEESCLWGNEIHCQAEPQPMPGGWTKCNLSQYAQIAIKGVVAGIDAVPQPGDTLPRQSADREGLVYY